METKLFLYRHHVGGFPDKKMQFFFNPTTSKFEYQFLSGIYYQNMEVWNEIFKKN